MNNEYVVISRYQEMSLLKSGFHIIINVLKVSKHLLIMKISLWHGYRLSQGEYLHQVY